MGCFEMGRMRGGLGRVGILGRRGLMRNLGIWGLWGVWGCLSWGDWWMKEGKKGLVLGKLEGGRWV